MTAIDTNEILKEIKLLKGVSDTAQDDLLNLTIKESIERILAFTPKHQLQKFQTTQPTSSAM